jgi:uracil-DNA glycosylase
MLWGNFAQKKITLIDAKKHLVLQSGHPSPLSANRGFWFGNNHFVLANNYLEENNKTIIDWII